MEVIGVAAAMIGDVLHLHGMQEQDHTTVITLPREGSTRGLSHLKRKDTVVRGHIHDPLLVAFLLHHIMGQGVAVKLQSESAHHIMAVQGAVAEVQLGGSVLRLGVTAGALVGALVVLPTRHDPNCNVSPLY